MPTLTIRTLLTLALLLLAAWLLPYTWQARRPFYRDYVFTAQEARTLERFPQALQAYGLEAWARLDGRGAAAYFRQAAAADPLYVDAWLKLAETDAAAGRLAAARAVLRFTHGLTAPVLRWKWPQTLLAHELDEEEVFRRNVDFLISRGRKREDCFNLVDLRYGADPQPVLGFLSPEGLPAYLDWLMRWQRGEAAGAVWAALEEIGAVDGETCLKYVDFLIRTKKTAAAAAVWRQVAGAWGMTNGGFEAESTGRGFDWRLGREPAERWRLRRAWGEGRGSTHALRLDFFGKENLGFQHAWQIVPVTPGEPLRLRWWWRAQGLTTDQGPFVEVASYDTPGLSLRSPMLLGSAGWREETLDLIPPEGCHAVLVRLRRLPSRRFDSRIGGTLWLDDFVLEGAGEGSP